MIRERFNDFGCDTLGVLVIPIGDDNMAVKTQKEDELEVLFGESFKTGHLNPISIPDNLSYKKRYVNKFPIRVTITDTGDIDQNKFKSWFATENEKNLKVALVFLRELKNEVKAESKSQIKQLGVIFNKIDDLLLKDEFDLVNMILRKIKSEDFNLKNLIGILSVTKRYSQMLSNRKYFFNLVKKKIINELGSDRVQSILGGLI